MICQVPFIPNVQKQVLIYLFSNHVQCASHQQELALAGALCELTGRMGKRALPSRKVARQSCDVQGPEQGLQFWEPLWTN